MPLDQWNEKIADLMNHGLNDHEIAEQFQAHEALAFLAEYCRNFRIGPPVFHPEEEDGVKRRVPYPRWSEIAALVHRLNHRADTDCVAAGGYLEDLHARLHNTTGELEMALERLERMGALIEEAAAKCHVYGLPENRGAGIPAPVWFRLLTTYRLKEEGEKAYTELRRLREVAGIAAETLRTVDNWLGNASTREAAMEALWRFRRILEAVGFPMPLEHLAFRGQLIRAMEECGVGLGEDGLLRLRRSHDKYWEPASGALVKEILESVPQPA